MSNVMGAPAPTPAPAPAPAPATAPLSFGQRMMPGGWKNWIAKPENRAALVQAGITLLQPLGVGQTVGGQFGEAIGAGMEARDRVVTGQQEAAQQALENQIAQQEADARTTAANAAETNAARLAGGGGLTAYQAIMADERRRKGFISFAQKRASDSMLSANPLDLSDPATVEQLAAEYESLNAVAPGSSPTLKEAIPGATAGPPQGAIDMLKNNPGLADQFDAKFGPGSAAAILNPAQ